MFKKSMFRPCIDLHQGQVKQIVGGTLSDKGATENFVSDKSPSWYSALYKKDQLNGGHIIMLGPNNEEAARNALSGWLGGMQIGGGISKENGERWLEAGASALIVTSAVFHDSTIDYQELKSIAKLCKRERLVLDLSCKKLGDKYFIATDRWTKVSDIVLNRDLLLKLAEYCFEYLIHAVDVEGKQSGPDEELITYLAKNSPITAVYAGGIRSLSEIEFIEKISDGKIDYTVGSALDIFGGKLLRYEELISR